MPLQGSLETFALPDVLTLLATTGKSGELRVAGDRVEGSLWVTGGALVASEVGRAVDHADAIFELLRLSEGTFVFAEGTAPSDEPGAAVGPLLVEAGDRLTAWREIEAVVPSLAVRVSLAPELVEPEIVLDAERWRALVAVAEGSVVGDVADRLGLGEFDACRLVRNLVEDGLVLVREALAVPEPAPDRAALDEVAELLARTVHDLEGAPTAAGVVGGADDGTDPAGTGPEDENHHDAGAEAVPGAGHADGSRPGGDGEVFDADAVGDTADDAAEDAGTEFDEDGLAALAAVGAGEHDDPLSALTEAASRIAALPPVEGEVPVDAEGHPLDEDGHGLDEPINRGLLLKFLSSVRS